MDAISPTFAAPPTSTPAPAAAAALSSDFETFLKMLAVQLKNQDPLNPVDSSDYAVQLATFSSVEQQVRTNQLLEGLTAQQTLTGMSSFAGWIGLEARSLSGVNFDGSTPIELAPNPLVSADAAKLVVYNQSGAEVARFDVPVSDEPYFWTGTNGQGATLAPGRYSFGLENYSQGELIVTDPVETYGRVIEARSDSGQVLLALAGDVLIPATAVTALRQPPG